MAKITLDTIVAGFKSVTKLISNFNTVTSEFNDKVLYRDNPAGEANQMENDFDMNSNSILNTKDLSIDTLTIGGTLVSVTQFSGDNIKKFYNTVANMVADNSLKVGDLVQTKGYTTANDGGGADYSIVAAATGTDDGGSYHDLTGISGQAELLIDEIANVKKFGVIANGALNAAYTAAMDAAFAASNKVSLPPGTYAPYTFAATDKTIIIDPAAIFKLPDGTIGPSTTEPVPTVHVTGTNLVFEGSIYVNGNLDNNDSASLNTSKRIGAVHFAGTNCRVTGAVQVVNANWVSVSAGSETDNADTLIIDKIISENSRNYATSFWSVNDLDIGSITVKNGSDVVDNRIRTGAQTASAKFCQDAVIGTILSEGPVVIEVKTKNLVIGSINALSTKIEDSVGVDIGQVRSVGTTGTTFAFAFLTCEDVAVGSVSVIGHNGDANKAVAFAGPVNCSVGTLSVTGTVNNAVDVEIRSVSGLIIDNMILTDPVGTGRGFFFDYDAGFAPQEKVRIGNIISKGHTGLDVEFQSPDLVDMIIGNINPDATTNVDYLANGNIYKEGFIEVSTSAGSGTITLKTSQNRLAYTKVGRQVTITGRLQVNTVSTPSGTLTIGSLPFPLASLDEESERSGFYVFSAAMDASFSSGQIRGLLSAGSSDIVITSSEGATETSAVSGFFVANSILVFNFSYFTD